MSTKFERTIRAGIIDSDMSLAEALIQNPDMICPDEILSRQNLLAVVYIGFDGQMHEGQIVIDDDCVTDVRDVFDLILDKEFPITSVIPIVKFEWNDSISMQRDNSSGFNYRVIAGEDRLSNHAVGRAIDINPKRNPLVKFGKTYPTGAIYNSVVPGTLTRESAVVRFLKDRKWEWGGDWLDYQDWQHFEKSLPGMSHMERLKTVKI